MYTLRFPTIKNKHSPKKQIMNKMHVRNYLKKALVL